jgi:hypothetical protein
MKAEVMLNKGDIIKEMASPLISFIGEGSYRIISGNEQQDDWPELIMIPKTFSYGSSGRRDLAMSLLDSLYPDAKYFPIIDSELTIEEWLLINHPSEWKEWIDYSLEWLANEWLKYINDEPSLLITPKRNPNFSFTYKYIKESECE